MQPQKKIIQEPEYAINKYDSFSVFQNKYDIEYEAEFKKASNFVATDVQAAFEEITSGLNWREMLQPGDAVTVNNSNGVQTVRVVDHSGEFININPTWQEPVIPFVTTDISVGIDGYVKASELETLKDEIQALKDEIENLKMLLLEN